MGTIKISIITTCYNAESTIERTIKSVIGQHYNNLDFILVDALSSDKTMDIVERYRDAFSYVISEKDRGIADGFNKGIRKASGDVIVILNSDDELYPGALNKINEAYDDKTDIFYGDCIVVDEFNETEKRQKAFKLGDMKRFLIASHQSFYITKRCYHKYGGYSLKYKLCTDYHLISKMYRGGASFKYVEYPLCRYRQGGCTYINPIATIREDMAIAKQNGLKLPQCISYTLYYLFMWYGKKACEKLEILGIARQIRSKFNKTISYRNY